jgi:hypothetical protein
LRIRRIGATVAGDVMKRLLCCLLVLSVVGRGSVHGAPLDPTHARWGQVLSRFVQEGSVDYAGLAASPAELAAYLREMGSIPESEFEAMPREAQIAFLINLYNAATLKLIADHHPVASIKKVGGWFKSPWDLECVPLFGRTVTLNRIEHQMLRPRYQEPRVHFALVCAARGCPPLRDEPYVAARLDAQLSDQARRFLAQPEKNRFDATTRTLTLSPIFKWYAGDFPAGPDGLTKFLSPFLPKEQAAGLASGGITIEYSVYDWSLNSRPTPAISHGR